MRTPAAAATIPTPVRWAAREVGCRPAPPERQRLRVLRSPGSPGRALEGGDPGAARADAVRAVAVCRASSPGSGEVAAILDPIARTYAGIDPTIIAPLLRWAWQRAFGGDLHPTAVTATAQAISERRPWRGALGM